MKGWPARSAPPAAGSAQPRRRVAPCAGSAEQVERELIAAYREQAPGLFRYATLLAGPNGLAEDLLQECFLRYLEALRAGHQVRNRTAWLYRVVRNCFLARQRAAPAGEWAQLASQAEPEHHSVNPEGAYHRHALARQMLRGLAPRELECVRLRAEGLSYAEIAEVLNIRIGTVGALLSRALGKCRALFAREEGDA